MASTQDLQVQKKQKSNQKRKRPFPLAFFCRTLTFTRHQTS